MISCAKICDELEKIYRFKELNSLSIEISSHLEKCPNCEKESRNLAFYFERVELIYDRIVCPPDLFTGIKEMLYKKLEQDFVKLSEAQYNPAQPVQPIQHISSEVKKLRATFSTPSNAETVRKITTKEKPYQAQRGEIPDANIVRAVTKEHYGGQTGGIDFINLLKWVFLIVTLIVLAFWGLDAYEETAPWKVSLIQGAFSIQGTPFAVNEMNEGDILTTSSGSEAMLIIPGGGKVIIHSNSEIKMANSWLHFQRVEMVKGKAILSNFPPKSSFRFVVDKVEIYPGTATTEVQRNILGKIHLEGIEKYSHFRIGEQFFLPKDYVVEISESSLNGIPHFRGTGTEITESVKRINNGIFTETDFKKIAVNSSEKDIFTLVQLLTIAQGESRKIIFERLREYSIPPGEIIRVPVEGLTREDIQIWADRLLREKYN
ncbi:MAG: hypothetical protein HUU54_09420 [Ignavibacteriaceae bacterium]|nr:hypothetical protein [Ignavibacteriaceae bacterium]